MLKQVRKTVMQAAAWLTLAKILPLGQRESKKGNPRHTSSGSNDIKEVINFFTVKHCNVRLTDITCNRIIKFISFSRCLVFRVSVSESFREFGSAIGHKHGTVLVWIRLMSTIKQRNRVSGRRRVEAYGL